ncbi:hypothetical protein C1646_761715 [Rhizophagus diaphanus]|nr:hypothetical protein C1646_761715 [Rhizophagus diaphanus] [Rhizophagus sp. MUCL 43196]
MREAKGAKCAKGTGGARSAGSARGLRRSKRVLDRSATYRTEEEKEEEEEDENESQQSTQQNTISTKPPVEGSIIRRSITPVVETSIMSPTVGTKHSQQQMSGTDDHHALAPHSSIADRNSCNRL